MKLYSFALLASLLLLCSCASSIDSSNLSRKDKAYLSKIKKVNTKFKMSKFKKEKAMRRGFKFVQKYSLMKLDNSDENSILTKSAKESSDGTIGYQIKMEEKGNFAVFSVKCEHGVGNYTYNDDVCKLNERILAHYIKTGELRAKFVNKEFPR